MVHSGLTLVLGMMLFFDLFGGLAERIVAIAFMLALMSLKVAFHEFGHALIAYHAGDRAVRGKGYLTLNMLRYSDPFTSLLLPGLIFLWSGIFLPGGAVYLNPAHIDPKKKLWVDLGGIIFDILTLIVLVVIAYLTIPYGSPAYMGAISAAVLLSIGFIVFNLLPIPPLDGYSALAELAPGPIRTKMYEIRGQVGFFLLLILFMFAPGMFSFIWDIARFIYKLLDLNLLAAYWGIEQVRIR